MSNSVHDFAVKVSKREGLKKQVDIAQIKEILRVANDLRGGMIYEVIRAKKILVVKF